MSHPSDNLYSANDDSDSESFSDELSPADGYFNPNGLRSDSMVQDPSMDIKVENKTLIPPPNAQPGASSSRTPNYPFLPRSPPAHSYASRNASSNSPPSSSSYTPVSPISPRRDDEIFSENSALLNGPPPAYTPSPVSPTTPHESSDRSYSTFPEHRLEVGVAPHREPESMGAPVYEPTERTPLTVGPFHTNKRRKLMHLAVAALVFILVVVFMTITFRKDRDSDAHRPPNPPVKDGPSKNRPVDQSGPYCVAATHRQDEITYEFPTGSDLTVLQTSYGADDSTGLVHVSTVGEIRLRRLPEDSKHGNRAYFTIETHVSDPSLEVLKSWDEHYRLLKISTPRLAKLDSRIPHCVSLQITAWIPENAEFDGLLIESISLTLRVIDDIKIKVAGQSKFATISGHIAFPTVDHNSTANRDDAVKNRSQLPGWVSSGPNFPFSSRRISVGTVSGHIDGSYPLMDFLGLDSQSGSISVDVIPQPVLETAPAPADLEVSTGSGSIKVNCPVGFDNLAYIPPPRNYIANVHSSSGSIGGSFYLGSESNFKSTSGSVIITGLPVLQNEISNDPSKPPKNNFATHTVSGTTKVRVLKPIFIQLADSLETPEQLPAQDHNPYLIIPPGNIVPQALYAIDTRAETAELKLRSLKSIHESNSALIDVSYPAAWEGTIVARTVSGNIEAKGDGLRRIKDRSRPASRELVARKGVEEEWEGCQVTMRNIAGSLHFNVGF